MQRDQNKFVSAGVQNCAKGTHREAPTASIHRHGDASVFANDADRRGAPVLWDTVFTNGPLQFEATTITRAHHPDLETNRRAPDDRVRGDPVVHCHEPVPHSLTVHRSTHHLSARAAANRKPVVHPSAVAQGPSTTPSPRSSCAAGGGGTNGVRLLGRTDKELCEGEVLLQVERDGEQRGGPQVPRQVIEELL